MAQWDDFPLADGQQAKSKWDAFPLAEGPTAQGDANFIERFQGQGTASQGAPGLGSALQQRAQAMTSGPPATPGQTLARGFENVLTGATQGTQPTPEPKNLVGRATVDEQGNLMAIDPITGRLTPTNTKEHVALYDPQDNQLKIYNRTAATNESPLVGLSRVLTQGMVTGAPTARPAIATGIQAAAPATEKLLGSFEAAKTSPEVLAVTIKPEAIAQKASEIGTVLQSKLLTPARAQPVYDLLGALTEPPAGTKVTMANIDDARYQLGQLASKGGPEGTAATIAKQQLDKWLTKGAEGAISNADVLTGDVNKAHDIMQEARGTYAAGKSAEMLTRKAYAANLAAERAGTGENLHNTIRSQLSQVLLNPELRRGLPPEVISRMEEAVGGGNMENFLRWAGTKLTGRAGAVIGAIVGEHVMPGFVGGMIGTTALPAVGTGMRMLAGRMAAKDIARINELVRSQSPMARSIQNSLDAYNKYMTLATQVPKSPRYMAMVKISSNNLSNNLRAAGIDVPPAALMGPAGAENEQQ